MLQGNRTRREMLSITAFSLAGSAVFGGTVSAGDADPREENEGELPNENVKVTDVHPFPNQPHTASSGDWIEHNVFLNAESPERLREMIDGGTLTVEINGELIDNPKQYFREFVQTDYVLPWSAPWLYYTPPKKPDTYPFSWGITLANGTHLATSHPYEVVAGGSSGSGQASVPRVGHDRASDDDQVIIR